MKVGDAVVWHGQDGIVLQLMFSLATQQALALVGFDPRIRLTVRVSDLTPVEETA